ncbi:MAG: M24 family metallopeptidase [Myxococcales bacterium]
MSRHFLRILAAPLLLLLACAHAPASGPRALPWSRQLAMREEWLAKRHALLLDMMRRHGIAMWMVVNEEFHDDPLTWYVAPPRPYAGGRDVFVFADAGDQGLKRYAVTGYAEDNLLRFFESPEEFRKVKEGIQAVVARHDPQTIALSIEPRDYRPSRGVTRSLTKATYEFLADALGPRYEARFVPAGPLIEEYLDTRLPEEREPYAELCAATEQLTREALSNEVITPGRTTVGDVRRFLYDRLAELGYGTWFQPDMRVQRKGGAGQFSRGFLAVAPESVVIERGDLLHVDFGLASFGLDTDWQKMAYVLREGETDAPAGLKNLLANTNALQEAVASAARPGRISAEVYEAAITAMKARSAEAVAQGRVPFTAQIYSHPLGAQGHGLGPTIDGRAAERKDPPRPLRKGSYLAVELNTKAAVPEWDGQEAFAMEEDPAELTEDGYRFFRPRQTEYYLIR